MNDRTILHVDMDAFFAAVEQRDHPEYRGKPLIVGADPQGGGGRGVVSTCSYEARVFGVHSAMPIGRAYKLCPHGIYVPPNGKLYGRVSKEIFAVFHQYTDMVEPLSIDEAFLDVTGSERLFGSGLAIAKQIKASIREQCGLVASVGVAPNKYLAKIASDLEKPDGLVVVGKDKIIDFLTPLPIARLWGAGKETQKRLTALGIRTIGELAVFPPRLLEQKFGKAGRHFYNLAHGIDNREVHAQAGAKSVSNEHTFGTDIPDGPKLRRQLSRLCDKVGYRLRKGHLAGKTIHLKLRYSDFSTITRNHSLAAPTADTAQILNVIFMLFEKNYIPGRAVRLIGVGVSGFRDNRGQQLSLFDRDIEKVRVIDELEDKVREKFGTGAIKRADTL